MKRLTLFAATLPGALLLASCGSGYSTDGGTEAASTPAPTDLEFAITEHGSFNEPWASAFLPGTDRLFITEKSGTMKFVNTKDGTVGTVSGLPDVDYVTSMLIVVTLWIAVAPLAAAGKRVKK